VPTTQTRETPSATVTPGRRTTCRYLRRSGDQCTAEVVDEQGEIMLCAKHLGRAMELVSAASARIRNGR
jgi:hypothetical protein